MADQSVTNNQGVAQAWRPAPRPTHPNWRDMTGIVFFRLTVREYVGRANKGNLSYWLCGCSCGGETVVSRSNLISGHCRSCGCFAAEESSRRVRRHGARGTTEYKSWSGMRDRCLNPADPAYSGYGGRGITIDPRWDTFESFFADMGPRPAAGYSIDRLDNDGPYSPENCRWATRTEQGRNKRNNFRVEFREERLTVAEIAERTGARSKILYGRLRRGWSVERAVSEPVHTARRSV